MQGASTKLTYLTIRKGVGVGEGEAELQPVCWRWWKHRAGHRRWLMERINSLRRTHIEAGVSFCRYDIKWRLSLAWESKRLWFAFYRWGHTGVACGVAVGDRVVGEKPVAKHREGIDVHPLVVGETLAHTQHGEEIPRHCPIQLCYGRRLTEKTQAQTYLLTFFLFVQCFLHSSLIQNIQ